MPIVSELTMKNYGSPGEDWNNKSGIKRTQQGHSTRLDFFLEPNKAVAEEEAHGDLQQADDGQ